MKWLANHKRREEMKKGEGRKTCNKSTKTCAGLSCRKYKMMLRESAEGTAKLLSRFSRARLCGPARLPRPWDSPGRNTGVGCHFLLQSMKEKGESLSRVRLCDPIDGSPPGSPIPGILRARTLEWVAISFST